MTIAAEIREGMKLLTGEYQDWRRSRKRELAQEKRGAWTFLLMHQLFVDI
jgi:hypothetical protein